MTTYNTSDFAKWGETGGKLARGDAKRRPPEHYARLAQIRAANKAKRAKGDGQ